MKKKTKSLLLVLFSILLCLSFTACGASKDADNVDDSTITAIEDDENELSTAETEDETITSETDDQQDLTNEEQEIEEETVESEAPDDDVATGMAETAGYYKVIEMNKDGEDMADYLDLLSKYGIYLYFTLNEDGTASMDMMDSHEDMLWDESEIWNPDSRSDAQSYVYINDTISIGGENVKMFLQRLTADEEKTFLETGGKVDDETLMKLAEEMEKE